MERSKKVLEHSWNIICPRTYWLWKVEGLFVPGHIVVVDRVVDQVVDQAVDGTNKLWTGQTKLWNSCFKCLMLVSSYIK